MIVSHEYKFVYFAPVKTASTSVHKALEKFNVQIYHTHSKETWARHQMWLSEDIKEYYKFLTVRNPYNRFLSMYNHFSEYNETIKEYSERKDPRKSSVFNEVFSKNIPINAILRVETLEKDFNNLPFVKEHIKIPQENISHKKIDFLSEEIIDFVNNQYHLDFLLFGYKKLNPKTFM